MPRPLFLATLTISAACSNSEPRPEPPYSQVSLTEPIKSIPDWYQAYGDRNIFKRWAAAREMAGPTLFLASEAASYVTGTVLFADGGWTAIDGRFTPPGM